MKCPICKIGNIEAEQFEPEADFELSCSNEKCESSGIGVYCFLRTEKRRGFADKFYENWFGDSCLSNNYLLTNQEISI